MSASNNDVVLNPDSSLADCMARRQINLIFNGDRGAKGAALMLEDLWATSSHWATQVAVRDYAEKLVSGLDEWEQRPQAVENEGISLVCVADVDPETVSWLWLPYNGPNETDFRTPKHELPPRSLGAPRTRGGAGP